MLQRQVFKKYMIVFETTKRPVIVVRFPVFHDLLAFSALPFDVNT